MCNMTCVNCHAKAVKEGLCQECYDWLDYNLAEYEKQCLEHLEQEFQDELKEAASSVEIEDFYYFSEPVDTYNIDGEMDIPF